MNALQGVTVILLLVATALVACLGLLDFHQLAPPHQHPDEGSDDLHDDGPPLSPTARPAAPLRRRDERRQGTGHRRAQGVSEGARLIVQSVGELLASRYTYFELDEYLELHRDLRRSAKMPPVSVAFQVTTSPSTRARIEGQKQGWLRAVPENMLWAFSSEAVDVDGMHVQTIPQSIVDGMGHKELANDTGGYWTGKIRKIAAYKVVEQELPPSVEWLVIADDDTFVHVENMRHVLGKMNPEIPVLIGHAVTNAGANPAWIKKLKKQSFVKKSVKKILYMQGGSGTAMSRAALRLIAPALLNRSDDRTCQFLGAEDATVGMCAQQLGVALVNNPYNYPNWAKARLSQNETETQICAVLGQDELATLKCPGKQLLRTVVSASWGPTRDECSGERLLSSARELPSQDDSVSLDFCLSPPRPSCSIAATLEAFGGSGRNNTLKAEATCSEIGAQDVRRCTAIHYVHADDQKAMQQIAASPRSGARQRPSSGDDGEDGEAG